MSDTTTDTADSDVPETKTLYLIRHGAGTHDETHDFSIHDPELTETGRQQAAYLGETFPHLSSIDLICASPLRRTLQTALIAFSPLLPPTGTKKILATPRGQEASAKPANTGSDLDILRAEFGTESVDWHICAHHPDFNSKRGLFATNPIALDHRAKELRMLLRERPERNIVLVAHGHFLHYLTSMMREDGEQEGGMWVNAEWRAYGYDSGEGGEEARLVEREESWRRRGARGPSWAVGSAGEGMK
ncbi:phosphoglycerate mutase-like protein [Aulographum hederae CBS 113979]|uniref:Phosphoglycerate mutase-like protein n=1 Tax=Aulographum hederae CBS 113979 TaxID=1176131 RepID=A0A6G1GLY5_9PEZI|nr:phosphoglycerate mutase-like protein [Aulographum hederae CBS 113979]